MQPRNDLEDIINDIRIHHRERCYAMTQRMRSELALLSFIRTQIGWSRDLDEDERKKIATRAKAIVAGKDTSAEALRWKGLIEASKLAKAPFDKVESDAVKAMKALAKELPAWDAFGKDICGFGEASLATIVGEAGDLAKYSNPAKLWKRMGLAVMDGVRQGGLKKSASAEEWIAHGYSRQRRSRMWLVGDAMIKRNGEGKYRKLYLERKAYEVARAPDMTPMQAHRRAQRVMEKRLLKELWQAWRRPIELLSPTAEAADTKRPQKQAILVKQPIPAVPAE